jgi:hypothetical protein
MKSWGTICRRRRQLAESVEGAESARATSLQAIMNVVPSDAQPFSSARKGKAVEHLIAASCILASGGELNASTSLVDDEGVDIVFHRRGRSRTLAVQVKSRFDEEGGSTHLHQRGTFIGDVRAITFQPRDNLYVLFVAVRSQEADFGPVWFVPSHEFHAKAMKLAAGSKLRMSASAKPDTQDQWRSYRLGKAELAPKILDALDRV